MKKSFYFIMMLMGIALTSCEPMEEIHSEVDADIAARPIEGITEYTLTDDDYAALDLDFGNFSSLEDAGELIPTLLSEKFPIWGEGSLAQVTFDLYDPIDPIEYTVTAEGYAAVDLDVEYFTETSQIKEFLEYQFPQAGLNEYVALTYRTIAVEKDYEFTDEDFSIVAEELGEEYPEPASSAGEYENFDRREDRDAYWSNEMILEAINVVLEENLEPVEGQTYEVSYPIYDGNPGVESLKVRYNGSAYVPFGAENYTLTRDDYDLIGVELAEEYPGPSDNAARFNSFDVNEDSDNFWTDAMILEAINVVLEERFPDKAEGDEFNVTVELYLDGETPAETIAVVKEDGAYVIDETASISTIMETTVFANGGDSWMIPLELPENIYTEEFEQRYNNFDDEDDAGFYISRYLEPLFPYAQDGDFVSVRYDYYDGDGVVTRYASFIYEDREWVFIPSVVQRTLQFGHEGSGWVVDNTIVYTLQPSDYMFIGEELTEEYPDPAWSVGNYENFDRRPGNRNQWTDAMLLEAFNLLLNEKVAPNAEEGQKYLLTFDIYNGTNTIEQMHLIKVDGVWVPVE